MPHVENPQASPPDEPHKRDNDHVATTNPDPQSDRTAVDTSESSLRKFLLIAVIGLLSGLAGSFAYDRFVAGNYGERGVPAVSAPAPVDSSAQKQALASLGDRLDRVKAQLDKLQRWADDQPSRDAADAAASLQVRVADLGEALDKLASVPGKLDRLDDRVSELSSRLTSVRGDVATLQSRTGETPLLSTSGLSARRVDRTASTTTPKPISNNPPAAPRGHSPAPPTPPASDSPSLTTGAELFRRGKYRDAREVFARLEQSQPEDARIWYFAALSEGLSTGEWNDGPARLVEKGLSLEAAGRPKSSDIDTAFKDLTSATGRDWLAAYRKGVKALK